MGSQDEILLAPALTIPNQYFIFRDNGEQVTVKIVNGNWHSDRQLNQEETKYLNQNLFKND